MPQYKSRNQNNNYNSKGKNTGNYRRLKSLRANAYQSNSNNSSNYRRLINNDANNQNKKPDDIPGTVPLLHYKGNADSNLSKWIEAIQPFLESLFGHLASFITTDTYYEPCAPISPARPWTKATDPGGIKRAIEKAKATEYARELSKIESDKPRMWGEIEKHMSTESKAQVKLDAEYSKLKQKS
jgi:hypothetical protein